MWTCGQAMPAAHTILYFHGGGFAFDPAVTLRFVAMLAQRLRAPVWSIRYRLTPEHAHPAQMEDALAAYRHLLATGVPSTRIVLCGDSAGGHLVRMLLAALRRNELPQPSLAIGLCPLTDIGRRGDSQFGHDRYDMLQGEQTWRFGRWYQGVSGAEADALSPMGQRYHDVAPIYLQAGGKEILVDMIRDFAAHARQNGAAVRLDVWDDMPHEFQMYGDGLPQSREALASLSAVIVWALDRRLPPTVPGPATEIDTFTA